MTVARISAVAAYVAAIAAPASADWRGIADQLYAAMPATRAKASAVDHGATVSSRSAPAWFADWKLGKVYSLDSVDVTFADGVTVRCNLAKAPNKAPRIASACRTAVAFYRSRTGRDSVPAFASIVAASDGQEFDAAACSDLTADMRVTGIVPGRVRPAVTAEAVERMERELMRRRDGLAASLAMPARIAETHIPLCLSWDARGRAVAALEAMKAQAAMAESWRAAVAAGEAELASMVAALDAAPCQPEPVLSPLAVAAIEAMREPEPAPCDPVAVIPDHVAAPVTVAAAEPVEAGNDDAAPLPPSAGPGAALAPLAAEAAPAPLAALISSATIVAPDLNTRRRRAPRPPVVGILSRPPVVGIPGGVLPASIMRQVIPGLARCPAPLLSAASF
jgi:hypothetical protein